MGLQYGYESQVIDNKILIFLKYKNRFELLIRNGLISKTVTFILERLISVSNLQGLYPAGITSIITVRL